MSIALAASGRMPIIRLIRIENREEMMQRIAGEDGPRNDYDDIYIQFSNKLHEHL